MRALAILLLAALGGCAAIENAIDNLPQRPVEGCFTLQEPGQKPVEYCEVKR